MIDRDFDETETFIAKLNGNEIKSIKYEIKHKGYSIPIDCDVNGFGYAVVEVDENDSERFVQIFPTYDMAIDYAKLHLSNSEDVTVIDDPSPYVKGICIKDFIKVITDPIEIKNLVEKEIWIPAKAIFNGKVYGCSDGYDIFWTHTTYEESYNVLSEFAKNNLM